VRNLTKEECEKIAGGVNASGLAATAALSWTGLIVGVAIGATVAPAPLLVLGGVGACVGGAIGAAAWLSD
jgi:hypothetical protein